MTVYSDLRRRRIRKSTRAHGLVRRALKSGELQRPETCSQCGSRGDIQGHHKDYGKPLDVEWLCQDCHAAHHAEKRGPYRMVYPSKGRLTTGQLAARLDVSERTLKTWRAEGMPYLPRGGQHGHLHPWEGVKTWLVQNGRAGFVPVEEGS